MQTVYLAGGMQPGWRQTVGEQLRALGFTRAHDPVVRVLNPVVTCKNLALPAQYAAWDARAIRVSDVIFAYMEADNPSGWGLAAEIGLAAGLGKTIILADERSATDAVFAHHYAFVHQFATYTFARFEAALGRLTDYLGLGV